MSKCLIYAIMELEETRDIDLAPEVCCIAEQYLRQNRIDIDLYERIRLDIAKVVVEIQKEQFNG